MHPLPVDKHKAHTDSMSADVKLTGSLRGLWGIENIRLMFAMSVTCKAFEVMLACSSFFQTQMMEIFHSDACIYTHDPLFLLHPCGQSKR